MNHNSRIFTPALLGLGLLLLAVACGPSGPTPTMPASVAHALTLVPTFTATSAATATDLPTSTATITDTPPPTAPPTDTATATPTESPTAPTRPTTAPTRTPLPTDTPTATPSPTEPPTDTPTAPPTQAAPAATRRPPTPTPVTGDGFSYDITMQRMLHIDENGGVIGNHNIYVHVFNANGDPLDGVVVCRFFALQLQPPDPHACGISGETGPGRMHFDVYSGDKVFVASADPDHRPLSAYTRPLEQEPAAMTDLQELVDNGYCESIEDCRTRMPINNLVRFHYSYEVHFQRRW